MRVGAAVLELLTRLGAAFQGTCCTSIGQSKRRVRRFSMEEQPSNGQFLRHHDAIHTEIKCRGCADENPALGNVIGLAGISYLLLQPRPEADIAFSHHLFRYGFRRGP